jgi:RNA polymerase sigma factor (TIGR02999 family)
MDDVTRILQAIEQGSSHAADELLPLVYDELRRLAARRLGGESPGQTLQATALVHEAYLRLVDVERAQRWQSRGHFFAAAAEAMRRILVERARERSSLKRGGGHRQVPLADNLSEDQRRTRELLALDEALRELEQHDPQLANLVKLRYFAGFTHQEAAQALGIGRRAADRLWALARAWLYRQIREG